MKWFSAITESGTEYLHSDDSSVVRIIPGPGASGYRDAIKGHIIVIPQEKIAEWINENEGHIDWEWVREAPAAEVPVVGAHLMVSGLRAWRLSTHSQSRRPTCPRATRAISSTATTTDARTRLCRGDG